MERRWEELDLNCLALIFARLKIEDKVVSTIPFVCKSWSRALMDPLCWRSLDLAYLDFWAFESFAGRLDSQYPGSWLSFSGLFKLALRRSQGSTTELRLPWPDFDGDYGHIDNDGADHIFKEDLELVEKECLGIKTFFFSALYSDVEMLIPKMVANWANLETLKVRNDVQCFKETLVAIKEHCPRFRYLMISGYLHICEEETKAIVNLPRLKRLSLYSVFVHKKCMMSILDGCKELEELHMEYCSGVLIDDDVVKYAAAIRTFVHENHTYVEEECDYDYYSFYEYLY